MPSPKSRWGLSLFIFAVALGATVLSLSVGVHGARYRVFYSSVVPWIGFAFSAATFFVGHLSYPRVHNLKVYLLGYVFGITGAAYFVLVQPPLHLHFPPPPAGFVVCLKLLCFANIFLVLGVPSFVKYRITRTVTLVIASVEGVWVILSRFVPGLASWCAGLETDSLLAPGPWLGPVFCAAAVALSLWRVRDDFYLGGIVAGAALLVAVAWFVPPMLSRPIGFEKLALASLPFFLATGTLIHWFTRIEHRVAYDPLLHIYNRNYCSRIISEQSNVNTAAPFSVAMVDIDHFKKVNDTYGHQAGDAVLYNVAQTILREVAPDGILCRYGGEELAAFFPQKTVKDVSETMERVRQEVEKVKTTSRKKAISVTVSVGISVREENSQSIIDVIHAADKALYRAKEGGRNQVKTGKAPAAAAKRKSGKD